MNWIKYLDLLPEVKKPEKKLGFNQKLKWTFIVLGLYFLLSVIPLYGLDSNYTSQFESLKNINLVTRIPTLYMSKQSVVRDHLAREWRYTIILQNFS